MTFNLVIVHLHAGLTVLDYQHVPCIHIGSCVYSRSFSLQAATSICFHPTTMMTKATAIVTHAGPHLQETEAASRCIMTVMRPSMQGVSQQSCI